MFLANSDPESAGLGIRFHTRGRELNPVEGTGLEVGGHFEAAGSAETAIPKSSQAKSVLSERFFFLSFLKPYS